jgi:hypothetical protein
MPHVEKMNDQAVNAIHSILFEQEDLEYWNFYWELIATIPSEIVAEKARWYGLSPLLFLNPEYGRWRLRGLNDHIGPFEWEM